MSTALIAPAPAAAPQEREAAADRNTLPSTEPVFEVKNYAKEVLDLYESGVIDTEKYKWLEEVFKHFTLNEPGALKELVMWERCGLSERLSVLRSLRVNLQLVWESWVKDWGLDPEKAVGKKPPPSYVAEAVAEAAVKLKLLEPVRVWLGEVGEYAVKVCRRLHFEEDLKGCVKALSLCGLPHYSAQQLTPPLYTALTARAEPLAKGRVNPREYLSCRNGVIDLETLTLHEDTGHLFTYELPPVDPALLKELREGRVGESYFVAKPFYQVLRKHYTESEWLKLKRVLGAILVPRTMKLLAIVVGPKDTRKTFLFSLLRKTLGGLAVALRLRDLEENRFALQHALGARVLLSSEEAQTVVRSVDLLKSVTGGDPLFVDRKFLPPVTMEDNPLKVIVFSNDMPVFKKWDDAFVDRLLIIETENPESPSVEEQRLIEEALRKPEDFLHFLLYCYWELTKNNYEIPEKGSEKYVQVLLEAQSNVFDFASELLEGELVLNGKGVRVLLGKSYSTEGSVIYDIYCEWCRLRGEQAEARNTFYQLFEESLREKGVVKYYTRKIMFRGIKVIPRGPEETELPFN